MKKQGKHNSKNKKDVPIEKKGDDTNTLEKYMHSIDIREKRIGIVFKVIYVFAIFFATLFLMISDDTGEELSTIYTIEVCLTAFLFCLLIKMIVYIFNELKCFKLYAEELSQQQIAKTEESYARIFSYVLIGGITGLVITMVIGYINVYITQNTLRGIFMIGIILGLLIDNAQFKKYEQLWKTVSDIIWTIVIISVMVIVKLGESA